MSKSMTPPPPPQTNTPPALPQTSPQTPPPQTPPIQIPPLTRNQSSTPLQISPSEFLAPLQSNVDTSSLHSTAEQPLFFQNKEEETKLTDNERRLCFNVKFGIIEPKGCDVCSRQTSPILDEDAWVKFTNPRHASELLEGLLKQREEGKYLDCVVDVNSVKIPAHKSVLSSFSDYIDVLFQYVDHPLMQTETTKNVIKRPFREVAEVQRTLKLDILNSKSVEALVDCAYRGFINVPSSEIPDLLVAADFLFISSVTKSSTHNLREIFNKHEHQRKLIKDLHAQREEGRFIDCVITICSMKISAHRSVLSAFSDYFTYMFSGEDNCRLLTEAIQLHYHLHPESVEALVNYAYTGEMVIPRCSVFELMHAADYLCIHSASDLCYEYIFNNLTTENCLLIYKQAVAIDNRRLVHDIKRYILYDFSEVSLTDQFLDLDVEFVLELLEDDELTMMQLYKYDALTYKYFFVPPSQQEEMLLFRVMRYAKHNMYRYCVDTKGIVHNHCVQLPQLLSRGVRLPLMKSSILSLIKDMNFCKSSRECRMIVNKAINNCRETDMDRIVKAFDTESVRSAVDTSGEKKISLPENCSTNWMTPRTLPHLAFSSIKTTDVDHPSNISVMFDDSDINVPVQYVTGMVMYVRWFKNEPLLSGLLVSYNDGRYTKLHEGDDDHHDVTAMNVVLQDKDERITAVSFQTHSPETYLIKRLSVSTNKGRRWGYNINGNNSNGEVIRPEGSLYLAYVKGAIEIIDGLQTLRDVEFVWATDKFARKTYDERHFNRIIKLKCD